MPITASQWPRTDRQAIIGWPTPTCEPKIPAMPSAADLSARGVSPMDRSDRETIDRCFRPMRVAKPGKARPRLYARQHRRESDVDRAGNRLRRASAHPPESISKIRRTVSPGVSVSPPSQCRPRRTPEHSRRGDDRRHRVTLRLHPPWALRHRISFGLSRVAVSHQTARARLPLILMPQPRWRRPKRPAEAHWSAP